MIKLVHENVRKIRVAKGVKKAYLAKKIGVTAMTYSRIEAGESKLDVERLKVLSIALGVEVSIFFDNELTDSVTEEIEQAEFQKQLA